MPAADAFRREGRRHSDVGRGRDQEEAAAGGNLHLSGRAARLLLRRARELSQGSRRPRLETDAGISCKAHEEIVRRRRNASAKNKLVPARAGTSAFTLPESQAGAPCVSLAPVPMGQDTPVPPSPQ